MVQIPFHEDSPGLPDRIGTDGTDDKSGEPEFLTKTRVLSAELHFLLTLTEKIIMSNTPYRYTNAFSVKYRLERERQPFTREVLLQLPKNRCGVYALWLPTGTSDAPERLYIGQSTTCVRRRLLQHLSDETNPKLREELRMFPDHVQFSVVFTEGRQATLALETMVIRELQPGTNRYKLKPPEDQE